MADTARTKSALATILADNTVGDISAQDLRDLMESVAVPHAAYWFSSAAETTISVAGTYVLAAGTTTSLEANGFTVSASNRATYTGALTRDFHVWVTVSLSLASGANDKVGIKVAKNGTVQDGSEVRRFVGTAAQTGAMACQWHVELAQNDYVELYVTNIDAATNVQVDHGQVFVEGRFE